MFDRIGNAASRCLAVALSGVVLAAASQGSQLPKEEAEGIIFERQQLMLQLEKDSETLGMIAAGLTPRDKLAATTRSIADAAKDSVAAFEPVVPGGRSKPEVWSKRADFMQKMQTFATKSEEMAKVAETGNMSAVTEMMIDALPCKACHDTYREPKKK